MAINFSAVLYLPCQDLFGRALTITPLASNPGAAAYTLRGIYLTNPIDIIEDYEMGTAMVSDQKTIVDIRDQEFTAYGHVVPQQGDLIDIPAEGDIPAVGLFEVTDVDVNGGGETTLTVRRYETAAP